VDGVGGTGICSGVSILNTEIFARYITFSLVFISHMCDCYEVDEN
jgi:hypothetical protein